MSPSWPLPVKSNVTRDTRSSLPSLDHQHPFAIPTTVMASSKPNKLAFLSMPAPASYVAGLGRGWVMFTTGPNHTLTFIIKCLWFHDPF